MVQALSALAQSGVLSDIVDNVFGMFGSKKSAEDSSALQYYYQSKLNKQNYGYNTKLINMQNAFNEAMMDKANDWNLDRWNESVDLANTAHQREMADLKAAGLNPILAANGGASVVNPIQSAQASSGNSQLSSSAGMPNIDYVGALSTANSIRNENKRVENELSNSKIQRQFVRAQELKQYSDIDNQTKSTAQQIKESDAKIREIDASIKREDKLANARIANYAFDNECKRQGSIYSAQQTANLKNELKGRIAKDIADAEWIKTHPGPYKFGRMLQNVAPALFGTAAVGTAGVAGYNAFKTHQGPPNWIKRR